LVCILPVPLIFNLKELLLSLPLLLVISCLPLSGLDISIYPSNLNGNH